MNCRIQYNVITKRKGKRLFKLLYTFAQANHTASYIQLVNSWSRGAAIRHTIAPVSCTQPAAPTKQARPHY